MYAHVENVSPDEVVLLVSLPGDRLQRVAARFVEIDAEEGWVEFRTPVCEEHEFDPYSAVTRNTQLVFGHLELRPEHRKYWFRHMLRIDGFARPQHFAAFIGQFAGLGDVLEREITSQDRW